MGNQTLIDVHTHYDCGEKKVTAIRSIHAGESFPDHNSLLSCGLHPWKIKDGHIDEKLHQLIELAKQKQIVAIGESGLDKIIYTPFEIQQQILKKQIELSEKFMLPLIIHCVRAYSELLALRKKHPEGCWIIHGFEGNQTLANQLISKNIHLSIGAALFNPKSKIILSIQHIPLSRLFFETDDQQTYSIEEIYEQASKLLKVNTEYLKAQIFRNFTDCFSIAKNDP